MLGDALTCDDISVIIRILAKLVKILQFAIPILLIALVIFDIFKLIVSQVDDKAKKDVSSKVVQRVIYAIIIFLVPTLVNFLLSSIVSKSNGEYPNWYSCWKKYFDETLSFSGSNSKSDAIIASNTTDFYQTEELSFSDNSNLYNIILK